jgi:hypothetical protein
MWVGTPARSQQTKVHGVRAAQGRREEPRAARPAAPTGRAQGRSGCFGCATGARTPRACRWFRSVGPRSRQTSRARRRGAGRYDRLAQTRSVSAPCEAHDWATVAAIGHHVKQFDADTYIPAARHTGNDLRERTSHRMRYGGIRGRRGSRVRHRGPRRHRCGKRGDDSPPGWRDINRETRPAPGEYVGTSCCLSTASAARG